MIKNKLIVTLIIFVLLLFLTKPILLGLYTLIFGAGSYLTFAHPYMHIAKNLIIVALSIVLLLWSGLLTLNPLGRCYPCNDEGRGQI